MLKLPPSITSNVKLRVHKPCTVVQTADNADKKIPLHCKESTMANDGGRLVITIFLPPSFQGVFFSAKWNIRAPALYEISYRSGQCAACFNCGVYSTSLVLKCVFIRSCDVSNFELLQIKCILCDMKSLGQKLAY